MPDVFKIYLYLSGINARSAQEKFMELNNLNDMTAFVASVKSGSFTAAAKQLGLTRSTIGKRIARLEARLNVRLLQRNTRNLAPTDEGRLFYERCTAVLEELENAEQCLAQRSIEPQGRLKISAPLVLGKTILPPLLADFLHRYPQTSVELSLTDDYADLISDGYDLALRNGNPPPMRQPDRPHRGATKKCSPAPPPATSFNTARRKAPTIWRTTNACIFSTAAAFSRWHFQQKGKKNHLSRQRTFQHRQRRSPAGTRAVRIRHRPAAALSGAGRPRCRQPEKRFIRFPTQTRARDGGVPQPQTALAQSAGVGGYDGGSVGEGRLRCRRPFQKSCLKNKKGRLKT